MHGSRAIGIPGLTLDIAVPASRIATAQALAIALPALMWLAAVLIAWLAIGRLVVEPLKAPLPVTETGYRSHFVDSGVVESFGGPAAFVQAWLDQEALTDEWRLLESASRQMALF